MGGPIRGRLGPYHYQLTCPVLTLHQYHVYPWVYLSTGQPAGVVVDSRSVTRTRGCVAGKGCLTGTGAGWALDTRGLTRAPA